MRFDSANVAVLSFDQLRIQNEMTSCAIPGTEEVGTFVNITAELDHAQINFEVCGAPGPALGVRGRRALRRGAKLVCWVRVCRVCCCCWC